VPGIATAAIELQVNGSARQSSRIDKMIWNVAEIIAHLSAAWELAPGDLIFTGTPEGVAAVAAGDVLEARVEGLAGLRVELIRG
jgi:fumarylpyruvate hydrolase